MGFFEFADKHLITAVILAVVVVSGIVELAKALRK